MGCSALEGCQVLTQTSIDIARWRQQVPNVGEESLTDYLLWRMSQLSCVRYIKFTRYQEARKTGADWEWWFVGNSSSFALRVQAKLLHFDPAKNYKSLAYKNQYGYQIETLIQDALQRRMLPFYIFYWLGSLQQKWWCRGGKGIGEGVFTTTAFHLYRPPIDLKDKIRGLNGGRSISHDQILAISEPLSCLLCCIMTLQKDDVVTGIYQHIMGYWGRYIFVELLESDDIMSPNNLLYTELPSYVEEILNGRRNVGIKEEDLETGAIVVVDLRERG